MRFQAHESHRSSSISLRSLAFIHLLCIPVSPWQWIRTISCRHADITGWQEGRLSGIRVPLTRYGRFSLASAGFEETRHSRVPSMSDPRTGGVAQAPKTQAGNGVKNLNGSGGRARCRGGGNGFIPRSSLRSPRPQDDGGAVITELKIEVKTAGEGKIPDFRIHFIQHQVDMVISPFSADSPGGT